MSELFSEAMHAKEQNLRTRRTLRVRNGREERQRQAAAEPRAFMQSLLR